MAKLSRGWIAIWMARTPVRSICEEKTIAMLVIESLLRGQDLGQYYLGPFVIMANHVHVLLLPSISPSLLLKSLKGVTAREANRLLHTTRASNFGSASPTTIGLEMKPSGAGSPDTLRGIR